MSSTGVINSNGTEFVINAYMSVSM
jgi:hypothetical protein